MTDHEKLLRRLAVSDDELVAFVLARTDPGAGGTYSARQTRPLCRLAALIAGGGSCASYQAVVDACLAAGASVEEIIDVLFEIAGTVGSARAVAAAPLLARAVGFDVDEAFEGDGPSRRALN